MDRLSQLRTDLASTKMLRAQAVGALMAAIIIIHCIALAAIVFTGPLLPFAVQGAARLVAVAAAGHLHSYHRKPRLIHHAWGHELIRSRNKPGRLMQP